MATYVNDLRLTELATGEGSGTWGTTTNLNLELIGEALGYGTQDCFASDADSTTTVADGASDPARAMYFKVTSSATLTATRTLTIAPNTVSRVMLIENATTGSQSIAISQGSGGNVTIASGQTKMVYLDGAGSGGAVVDAMADLELGTITVADLTATTADINGGTIDGATIATSDITVGSGKTLDVSAGTLTLANDQISGDAINGGTATPTTLTSTTVNATTVDTTNIELTNLKAKDGTAAGSIADSTGVVTLASSVLTTADINGGTIDGVTIGGSSAGAITGTTGQFNTSLNVDGTVTADGLTVDGSTIISGGAFSAPAAGDGLLYSTAANGVVISGDGSDSDIMLITGSGGTAMTLDGNRDIAFYDSTGTSKSFFWDASAERLGLGTTSPATTLDVEGNITLSGSNGKIYLPQTPNTFNWIGDGIEQTGIVIVPTNDETSERITFAVNNSEAMRITSAGNVGIGASSPVYRLDVKQGTDGITAGFAGSTYGIRFDNGGTFSSGMSTIHGVDDTLTSSYQPIMLNGSDVRIGTGATERARIDSSGNLLVGNTIANPASGFSTQRGFGYTNSTGAVEIATTADAAALQIGKNNANDGSLLVFRKQGTTVGSIGTASGYTRIVGGDGTNGSGLLFSDAKLYPVNAAGSIADASIDLGVSGYRFKDLYLSGGVYLGGTGAANQLDDYEEGTFTPTVSGVTLTIAVGRYTKVGRTVFVEIFLRFPSTADATNTHIGSLPFNSATASNVYFGGISIAQSISTHVKNRVETTLITPYKADSTSFTNANFSGADVAIGGWYTT